jgi:transmembrane sensor
VSEAHRNFASAVDVEASAALWLERRDRAEWSAADEAQFDAWLAQSPAHVVTYWRLEGAWDTADRLAVLRGQELDDLTPAYKSRWPMLMSMAAAVAIIATIGATTAHYVLAPRERIYATDVGGHESITFADGTQIELNTDTVLRAQMTTAERVIWLDRGEAYFQVKHDAAHPFTVIADNHRITDLGTKFVVRRDRGNLEVALVDGRVRVGNGGAQSALLAPGDDAVATATSLSVTKRDAQDITDRLAWRRGVLTFKYATLADAATELNRYNAKKLVITDPAVARLKIYGTFQLRDVDVFARAARDVLGLHVKDDGNEILIER